MTADNQTRGADTEAQDAGHPDRSMYLRFGAMIGTSVVVMYLVTYLNVFDVAHIHFSEERVYMALTMGGAMGVVMMVWMWGMYADRRWNIGIIAGAVLLGVVATFLSQSQLLVEDGNYMRGMIPHHSIAILTSERAGITDVRVRELANEIIEAQRREIAEMEWLLADIADNGEATTGEEADARPVPSFEASP
ncbi:MAG: DUF305 domain-containing protein [Candidatus Limnocylindria bacterium]